jgi:trehalose 6-phosphate synthase/phosphatase
LLKTVLLRFALPVIVLAATATLIAMPFIDRLITEWFRGDVELRAALVMKSTEGPVAQLLERDARGELAAYLDRVAGDERLVAIHVCTADGHTLVATPRSPPGVTCSAGAIAAPAGGLVTSPQGSVQVSRFPIPGTSPEAFMLIAHDLSFADRRRSTARDYLLAFVGVGAIVLALAFVAAAWWSIRRWSGALISDIRSRRFLEDAKSSATSLPILSQVRQVMRELERSQRLEIEYRENWTPAALQQVAREHLEGAEILVVSNREPYIHNFDADGVARVQVPASGMVTALEPVMRACTGTWIAHGSGTADRAVVDARDGIAVPPDAPTYRLRRVWLTAEQEAGYYYGLANEGLWPLCHLAYVRPEFRESDWNHYVDVNGRFARVVAEEARTRSPVVLIQDYHFALLPANIRKHCPEATIVLFWHIPWPSSEAFGVCPWKRDLLLGMLQADILGFHTRWHCQNFLATVDRYVECQIDHEHMTVTVQGHLCRVAAYPISIEWPPRQEAGARPVPVVRDEVRQRFGIPDGVSLGLGIERWDFTKGILERFTAIEHLLTTRPGMRGRVTLLQIVAPSRSKLPAYKALQQRTWEEVERINGRFERDGWRPIVLLAEHQEPASVYELYRAADFCLVNSLHDGMNLVAKEFIAARDDLDGVLILSTFAGASRELLEALLVNPYDAIETADAIEAAVLMPREDRLERMRLMRRTVKENNVYRWAGRMLVDAAQVRQRQRLQGRAPAAGMRLRRAR